MQHSGNRNLFPLTPKQTFAIASLALPIIHFFLSKVFSSLSFVNGASAIWPSAGLYLALGKGTGLGLSIVRQVVEEKHDGKLSFVSESGKGCEFAIMLRCH
jgi:signal transduction histidine kinase